jgi:hypothetical protein
MWARGALLLALMAAKASAQSGETAMIATAAGGSAGRGRAHMCRAADALPSSLVPAAPPPLPPPTLVLQLSDLHLSNWTSPSLTAAKGAPGPDAAAFAAGPLAGWRPAALLLTGDLTHAKGRDGQTRQSGAEWEAYGGLVGAFGAALGGGGRILDVRGNHDAFDVPRRGDRAGDGFATHGASAARAGGGRVLPAAVARGAVAHGGADGAPPPLPSCPSLLLLGVDATPSPGLRGSNNFAGVVPRALAEGAASAASRLHAAADAACDGEVRPPLLAYGHYPLATLASPRGAPPLARVLSAASSAADAYVAGHLHSLFGPRMRRALPRAGGGALAELEAAAWTDDRRFRVATADAGALAFTDAHWASPAGPDAWRDEGGPVLAWPDGVRVGDWLLHTSYPPDGRLAAAPAPTSARVVRVLALAACVDGRCPEAPERVVARFECAPSRARGDLPLARAPPAPGDALGVTLWAADWPATGGCAPGDASAILTAEASRGDRAATGPPTPAPLVAGAPGVAAATLPADDVTPTERFFLAANWRAAAARLFHGLWAAHFFVALLLPRALASLSLGPRLDAWVATVPALARPAAAVLTWPVAALADNAARPSVWLPQAAYSAFLQVGPWAIVRSLSAAPPGLLFPFGVLLRLPGGGGGAERADAAATPPPWTRVPTPDAVRVGALHLAFVVGPSTLWLAGLARRRRRAAARGGGRAVLDAAVTLLSFLPVAYFARGFAAAFAWQVGGPLAIAAAPGLTWCAPLALALAACTRARAPPPGRVKAV